MLRQGKRSMSNLNRRAVLAGAGASLAGIAFSSSASAQMASYYGPVRGGPSPLPAAPLSRINPAFLRARVAVRTREQPGTIIIDPARHYLYLVGEDGTALR